MAISKSALSEHQASQGAAIAVPGGVGAEKEQLADGVLAPAASAPAPTPVVERPTPESGRSARSEAILDGAAQMFAEHGYHGASLRNIADQVGLSHPGMLHHFPTKDTLLDAVIDRMEAHAQGALDRIDGTQIGRRVGRFAGALEWSCRPSSPCSRKRPTHFESVVRAMRNSAATCAIGRPASTTWATARCLPTTVNGALRRCMERASCCEMAV